jgi:hypothetical protein
MPGITFESVDNQYEWGYYFDFKVLIMFNNGYFNETRMCKDEGKQFKNWLKNDSSKDLINRYKSSDRFGTELALIKNMAGPYEYRGTYVPRCLITSIASWISADLAFKIHDIVEEYIKREQKKIIGEKYDFIIHEKDRIIDEQANENMSLKEMLKKTLENTERILSKNDNLSIEMSKLSLDNQITHEMLDNVQESLDIVVEDRVVKLEDKNSTSSIVIYESIDQGPNMFYIFRVQKRGLKAALKRYKADNPNAVKFYEIEYNPNSINYFQRFKHKYKNKITSHYNKFELLDITKDQLREFIEEINNEKYQIESRK